MHVLLAPASEVLDRVLLFHVIDHDILMVSAGPSVLQPKGRVDAGSAVVGHQALTIVTTVRCWREDELGG